MTSGSQTVTLKNASGKSVVIQRETSKRGTEYAYDIIPQEINEHLDHMLEEGVGSIVYGVDYKSGAKFPVDLLTWGYLDNIVRPYFEEIWNYAITSYKVAVGDSQYFRTRTRNNKPTAFAYSAETDIDKICSLASEYIRHFEFGIGDEPTLAMVTEVLNEFSEKYIYTYENIQAVVTAFKNVMLFGIVWLHVRYDHETTSFSITHILPSSIMFSNIGRVSHDNIDWLIHEDLMSRQAILHTFCPVLSKDDVDVQNKKRQKDVEDEIQHALDETFWDGKYCTPKNIALFDEKRSNPSNKMIHNVIYKYYRYFKKKSKTYIYLKRVFINRQEIKSLTEFVDYIPYVPFLISDSYEHSFHAPYKRFQSIVTRAESEIMLISLLLSSAASRSANEISSLVMIDKKLLSNQSLNMEDLQNKTIIEVENEDQVKNMKDNIFSFDSTNPANYGLAEIKLLQELIAFKFHAIINKDSIFKSGVHYTSVANHQMKVASTTLTIVDIVMVGIHDIVKKVIKQTLIRNPKVLFTKQMIERLKKMRSDIPSDDPLQRENGLFGVTIRQMANYILRIIDTLHCVPTQSTADSSKQKEDVEKIFEINNATTALPIPMSSLLQAKNMTGPLYEKIRSIEKAQEEINQLRHQLSVETILAEIEEIKAKTLEAKAKALKLKAEVKEIETTVAIERTSANTSSGSDSSSKSKKDGNKSSKSVGVKSNSKNS